MTQTDLIGPDAIGQTPPSLPVTFVFPYRATVVRKKHRLPKPEMFVGTDCALIPIVTAPIAYLISFPATQAKFAEERYLANELEVRFHNGTFYWPFEAARDHAAGARGSFEACKRWLIEKRDVLGLLGEGEEFPKIAIEDVPVREVIVSDRDATCRRAIEKIEANLIACDGRIYQLGGAPVYTQRRRFHLKIGVAAMSPGFRVSSAKRGLRRPPGDANDPEIQTMLQWGRIWNPRQRTSARKAAVNLDAVASMPQIRIMDERADAAAMDVEVAQTDALHSEAMALADISGRVHEWKCQRRADDAPLFFMDENALDDRQLTRRRLAVLWDLHEYLRVRPSYSDYHASEDRLYRLKNEIWRFAPQKRLKKYAAVNLEIATKAAEFTEEEDDFISKLTDFG